MTVFSHTLPRSKVTGFHFRIAFYSQDNNTFEVI
jgi:hypothetical protein